MYDPGQLYFDQLLTDFSVGYQDQNLYAPRIFPVTPVRARSARYRVFDRSNWVIYPSRREPGTVANEVRGAKWSEDTFNIREHSLQSPIHDEERDALAGLGGYSNINEGAGLDLNPEVDATELVTRSIMLEWEKKVADTMRNTANYPGNHVVTLSGASRWDDYTGGTSSTSDPVTALRVACMRIYLDTGRWPNTAVFPIDSLGIIEGHPRVVDRFKNFSLLEPEAWKALLNVPAPQNVFVVDSRYNSADNIDATENIVSFWGQDVWVGIVDDSPGQKTKTFGKTFAWPYDNGGIRPTDKWREENRKSDIVRVSQRYDLKIVSSVAGYIIKTAVNAVV